jgi:protein-S-isoprenylcysteine O-methyltransferase Ste14
MTLFTYLITGCWVVFILFWIYSSFGIKRDVGRNPWRSLWWLRIAVAFIAVGWLWGTSSFGKVASHFWLWQDTTSNIPIATLGVVLSVLGIGLAIWARVHLGRNWSPMPSLKEEHELVVSGPYKQIRHPIYTGMLLAILGSVLVNPQWIIIFVVAGGLFVWRVWAEEKLMMG